MGKGKKTDPYTQVQRQLFYEKQILNVGVPQWYKQSMLNIGTFTQLTPRAAKAIMGDFAKGYFRSEVSSDLVKYMTSGQFQRTSRLLDVED